MILVDAHGLTVSRPSRTLFKNLSVTVATGDRLGILGVNGSGKSTLLRVLAGAAEPERGLVRRGRGVRVAYLDQRARLPPGTAASAVGCGWRGTAALDRLGVDKELASADVSKLSVGQTRRVALAAALVTEADLLVLDEPTNHLDLDTVEWLEAELVRFKGGLVLVTHDRRLLDRLATRVLELDWGSVHRCDGGYAAYLKARAAREATTRAAETTRRNLVRRELAWLRRGARARTRKSKARLAASEALLEKPQRPSARREPLELDQAAQIAAPRLGCKVLELQGVDIGYRGAPLLVRGLDLVLNRSERLGVVGANGTGKSTLLSVMAGRRAPQAGRVVPGPTARIGYHRQRPRDIDPSLRVHEALAGPGCAPTGWHAALLERFWFDADAQRSPVEMLSGGERRRLQLVVTLAAAPNVLLLDEPTNDLDLDTLRALEDLLRRWPGAVVTASHDRDFLAKVASDVIVLNGEGWAGRWPGGHNAWVEHRRSLGSPASRLRSSGDAARGVPGAGAEAADRGRNVRAPDHKKSAGRRRSASTLRHRLAEAEAVLDSCQQRLEQTQAKLEAASDDYMALARLGSKMADAIDRRSAAEARWLELSLELEELEQPLPRADREARR